MNSTNITLSSDLLPRPYAYLYEELCIYFLRWYLPATIIVGTMGTLFSLFFLFCSKLFQSNMLLWLSSICIGDFFILMLEGMWILLKVWFKYDIRDHNDLICKIHKASSNYALYWSAYMQSALSVQRAYLVFKPLHARGRGGISKKHVVAWILISLILIAPVAPYIIYWRIIDGDCDPTDRDIFYLTTLCDLIIWGIIPLLGMTVSTVVICLNMAKLGNKFKRAKVANSKRPRRFSVCITPEVPLIGRRRGLSTPTITSVLLKSTTDAHTLSSRIMEQLQQSEMSDTRMEFPPTESQRQLTEHSSSRHNAPDNFGHVTRLLILEWMWIQIFIDSATTYFVVSVSSIPVQIGFSIALWANCFVRRLNTFCVCVVAYTPKYHLEVQLTYQARRYHFLCPVFTRLR
ncbi:hypothetical protein TcWFU_002563 [Taenia crassiceps]|uniref:G-protein coupled receptors family 1 profile domain-containing protein n=1 Tax=Taenia crassiceps TaxID=6207 RepID=A0ABR4Q413_9CEST